MDWGTRVTTLGTTTLKDRQVTFGIKDADRTRHFSILGRAGSGRGTLLTHMALQDIARGMGALILDAAGTVAPLVLERLEANETSRLIYLDPADAEYPYTWNPLDDLKRLPEKSRRAAVRALVDAVYPLPALDAAGLVDIAVDALMKKEHATLAEFYFILTDAERRKAFFGEDADSLKAFEERLTANADVIKTFTEEAKYVGKDTLIRNLVGQKISKFSLEGLAKGQIVVVDFSKIRMFPTRMNPLVRVFVAAAEAAADDAAAPIPIYLHDALRYLDDAAIEHAFSNSRIALTVSDTMIQEADKERREKALARCGSVASFATNPSDRSLIERAFYPYADPEDLAAMEKGEVIVALTIDAVRTKAFFAKTLPLGERKNISSQDLMVASRSKYALSRTEVDATFTVGKKDGEDGKPKDGAFSDAFRNIFAKRAGGASSAPPPPPEKKTDTPPETSPAPEASKESKPEATTPTKDVPVEPAREEKSKEVSEEDLRAMLYVTPLSA